MLNFFFGNSNQPNRVDPLKYRNDKAGGSDKKTGD